MPPLDDFIVFDEANLAAADVILHSQLFLMIILTFFNNIDFQLTPLFSISKSCLKTEERNNLSIVYGKCIRKSRVCNFFKVKKWTFSIKRAKNDDFKGDKIICI